jgi:hypothetical protein
MNLVYLSNRLLETEVYWRNITPPLERAFGDMADTTVITPPPLRRATFRSDRPAWLSMIKTVRRADAVFWVQGHLKPPTPLWALAYVPPLAVRSTLVLDAWGQHLDNLAAVVDKLGIHRCYVLYTEALPSLSANHGALGFRWLPMAANSDVFTDLGHDRDIYAFWLGRRHDALHEALRRHCSERNLVYRFTTGGHDPATVEELQQIAARSRYIVATPPDVNDPVRTGGYSPLTSRYIEGPLAGARSMGVAAVRPEMDYFFEDGEFVACAEDGSDLSGVLDAADSDPKWEERRTAARDRFRQRHTWAVRALEIRDDLESMQ